MLNPVHGTEPNPKRWYFDFYNQWAAFAAPSRMNWIDFTFFNLAVEYSPYKASCEVNLMVLGLGGCLTFSWYRPSSSAGEVQS